MLTHPIGSQEADNQSGTPNPQEWLSGRLFFALLAAAVFLAFPRVLLGLDTFVYRDFGSLSYPQAFYERQSLLRGELPFWNPYSYCGAPFMAQWGTGTWYPAFLLHMIFPVPWSINFFHLLHLLLGGSGMYWLLRRGCGLGTFAAAFGGFAYAFNGVKISCLYWLGYTAFLGWAPWVLGCTIAAWKQGGRWIPVAAIVSALQVLACAPELLVLFWLTLGLLWLREVAKGQISFWLSLRRLALVVLLAAGITMVQMLPFFDLLAHAQRDRNFGDDIWAMPGWGLANLIVPLFHCYKAPLGPWFQPGQALVCSYYLGVGVLVLAIAGAVMKRGHGLAIMAVFALFCWIMALGSKAGLYAWIRATVPWIGIARYPVKFALFPVLLVPLMAAFAVDKITRGTNRREIRFVISVAGAVLLLMAGILWMARKHPLPLDQWDATALNALWRALLSLGVVGGVLFLTRVRSASARIVFELTVLSMLALDAFTHSPQLFPALPAFNLSPGMWTALGRATPRLGEGRIMHSPEAELYLRNHGGTDLAGDFSARRLGERNSLNLLDSVPKVAGGGMILRPAKFDELEEYLYSSNGAHYGQGLLDFLSVAWFTSPASPLLWSPRTNWLPVITAGQRPAFATDDQALRFITDVGFEPREVVYLTESARSFVSVTNQTRCKIVSAQFSANKIEADLESAETSMVVLSQSFYHLWRPFIDGSPTRLLRANLGFQAVQVPVGRHHLTLVYRDIYFSIGGVITLIALLIAGGWIWAGRSRERILQVTKEPEGKKKRDEVASI